MAIVRKGSVLVLSLLAVALAATAQNGKTEPQDAEQSCRTFVQDFYDWYVEQDAWSFPNGPTAYEVTLRGKRPLFSPILFQALKSDRDAQERSPDIVGLDFDPFLATNGDALKYSVGKVSHSNGHFLVQVMGFNEEDGKTELAITAELARQKGNWIFVNFHYPPFESDKNPNLLSILRQLSADRKKTR